MTLPILYSFRRCPYAMRGRLGLFAAKIRFEWREILLRDKPQAMLDASPKGTVPVFVLQNGDVIEESLDLLLWSLSQNDPENWQSGQDLALIVQNDGPFKDALDRYKYPPRYPDSDPKLAQQRGIAFIHDLEMRLRQDPFLSGQTFGVTDAAILPFIRQFAHVDRDWFYNEPSWPHVAAWLDAFLNSSRFQTIMVKVPQWDGHTQIIHPDHTSGDVATQT